MNENKVTLFLLYTADLHFSDSSKTLVGVFGDKRQIVTFVRKNLKTVSTAHTEALVTENKTFGLPVNLQIIEAPLCPISL